MKSLIALWKTAAYDFAARCHTSATMDMKTVQGRVKSEGLSFFTITLLSFGKEFRSILDQGICAHTSFPGFKRSRRGPLPLFLGGFLERIFDPITGVLRDDPDIEAIFAVHQLTLMFSKLELECSAHRVRSTMSDFVACESQVKEFSDSLDNCSLSDFSRMSRILFTDLLTEVDKLVYDGELIPKHGPGATADKLYGNGKFNCRLWTERLEKYFPAGEYLFPTPSMYFESIEDVMWLEPGAEMPVHVISVPKTQKGPRIIAIEPTCMQFVQQAMLEAIVPRIESSWLGSFLGFTDQGPNQAMARDGSLVKGDLATLDLSDASDRVPFVLVEAMLQNHPHLLGAVSACRSQSANVPGHGVITLSKFASMGSALTFPIEAMVFLTCVFLGIEREFNNQYMSRKDIQSFRGKVRIYGDDIIIPLDYVDSVIDQLERFNAKVGDSKSFWTGRFRESCGREYFDGHDITVVKFRQLPPDNIQDAIGVISSVKTRNLLYQAGLWKLAGEMDRLLRAVLKYYPNVGPESPALGRESSLGYAEERFCENLHRPQVKAYVVDTRIPINSLDGPGALLKFFLKRGGQPSVDGKHLERSGRPRAVNIKPRWTVPY
ncbi:TPA_asm: RNA-directed RNA polymerase [ssRNA phage Gerhypos.1_19]|uniref:RNA-directed RNA polymerase n=2 Tax=Leviviricetes TaxID=2842243 RepID=A0A8S5L1T7_9VIRU|nr:RNA-directed RNA polymerase [ssRNA phage Gerhypos.1_19]QDH89118.1 MAG: RNA-dependent RNA polymerase [Leviviridae sp.]DAD51609.1 TPA_asm: RNA-directed RNA polymerase [ssRNA phage Gerhypos.1_19]